jgi:hypothetical protein
LYRGVPDEWLAGRLNTIQAQAIMHFLARQHMPYICPICRVDVKEKPTVVYALNTLMEAMDDAFGPPNAGEVAVVNDNEDFWVGYFHTA